VKEALDLSNFGDIIWSVLNNIDAVRDCYTAFLFKSICETKTNIDGTRKYLVLMISSSMAYVTVMDDKTIEAIDAKWEKLGLGN